MDYTDECCCGIVSREAYVHGVLNEQLLEVLEDANHTFDKISAEYFVIFK